MLENFDCSSFDLSDARSSAGEREGFGVPGVGDGCGGLSSASDRKVCSRFGALGDSLETPQLDTVATSPSTFETRKADRPLMKSNQAKEDGKLRGPETTCDRPSPNEVRRRRAGG